MSNYRFLRKSADLRVDAEVGNTLIEVKSGVADVRTVRTGLMNLAYVASQRPQAKAILVLVGTAVTKRRLEEEWRFASTVFRPELMGRLSMCVVEDDRFFGIPSELDMETRGVISEVIGEERIRVISDPTRGDASFVILKVLLHHWLVSGESVTSEWLSKTCGYSYLTVAGVVQSLGSLVERESDRRLRLRWFSRKEFARLLAMSDRARGTARFADRSGHPRALESHIRRLEKLNPPGLAIGGILGARHYVEGLDLIGTPRLDLSQHAPKRHLDLDFIRELDPALRRVEDPLEPATVVVHAVRHKNPIFSERRGGLMWADPVECLLDLDEARLPQQTSQLLDALKRNRPGEHERRAW